MTTPQSLPQPRPGDPAYLAHQRAGLLRFAAGSRDPLGFAWVDDAGAPVRRPVELWITCRMTHVFSLGLLAAEPAAAGGPDPAALRDLAEHGVRALRGPLHDAEHGGWFAAVAAPTGGATPSTPSTPSTPFDRSSASAPSVVDDRKQAYGHAFVVLAASSAAAAGLAGATDLLDEALAVHEARFWDDREGLVVEEWDRSWTTLDGYRGVNAVMHTVEAYLAAGDVTGEVIWHERAGRMAARVAGWARDNDWRIPEHFDERWQPMLEHHRDRPADPFRPYGATVGHGWEWARLMVAVDRTLGERAPAGLVDAAVSLAERAEADGWDATGGGFVYTTDWSGQPVVRARMHWVLCEAVATADVLARVTGEPRWREAAERWWAYADRHLVDHVHGSWHHELDESNRPSSGTWAGKPDVYHAYQAALLPELPVTPSFAAALAAGHGPAGVRG